MADLTIRTLKIIKALAGKSVQGMSLDEITKATGESKINCLRVLQDMVAEGFATQFKHNRNYALSTACLAIATAHSLELAQAQDRINALSQRVTAHAHQFLS